MRATSACAWCRRSKIKCVHDGTPPCRACLKSRRTCKLTLPGEDAASPTQSSGPRAASNGGRSSNSLQAPKMRTAATPARASSQPKPSISVVDERVGPLGTINPELVTQAVQVFMRKFVEFPFLHPSTFLDEINKLGTAHQLKLSAIIALCGRFVPGIVPEGQSHAAFCDSFADFVRRKIFLEPIDSPDVDVIQCLLIIGLHEWGACRGFRAWLDIGLAIRMCQALVSETGSGTLAEARNIADHDVEIRPEIQNRTLWSCYIMDQLLSCGKNRPVTLQTSMMQNCLPLDEDAYAFGEVPMERYHIKQAFTQGGGVIPPRTMNHQFSIIVQGVDIWAQLSRWVAKGARRAYHGPKECPWISTSSWGIINHELKHWRSQQDERVRYSKSRLYAHLNRGCGEGFAFINLIYYLCQIFLHREFMPFIPLSVDRPRGPVEAPLYDSIPPNDFWEESARTLFDAAQCITEILTVLEQSSSPFKTPFVAFCAFTAANMNCYAEAFPWMNPCVDGGASQRLDSNISYLTNCANMWKIAEGWANTTLQFRRLYSTAASQRDKFHYKGRRNYHELEDSVQEYGSIVSPNTMNTPATADMPPQQSIEMPPPDTEVLNSANQVPLQHSAQPTEPFSPFLWNLSFEQMGQQPLMSFVAGEELLMFDDVSFHTNM